jgi:hypothetical protein
MLFDNENPKEIIYKLYQLNLKNKIKLIFASIPISLIYPIIYIDLDPILIQMLSGTAIIFCVAMSVILNCNRYLLNFKNLFCIVINITGCILSFINMLKPNIKIGVLGLILMFIILVSNGIVYAIIEKLKELENFNMDNGAYTFSLYTFLFIDSIFLIIFLIPVLIYTHYVNILYLDFHSFNLINSISILVGLFNGPFYIYVSKIMMMIRSIDISIINNLKLVIMVFITCIFRISEFSYWYIISLVMIIISSILIVYFSKQNNNVTIYTTSI